MSAAKYGLGLLLVVASVVTVIGGLLLAACWPRRVRLPRHDRHGR
ncbi:hypothetical protein OG311_38130 (plasmid) [Streptomyces sp. NBC_01343]|nr:hypothetical protein OG311_38130 [Streptomyces sp. NBC_01343]